MRKRLIFSAIMVVLAAVFSYPFFLNALANHLIIQDKLTKADVIIVLGGDSNGERMAEGVSLYHQGWAPYLLMTGGPLGWHLTHAQNMKRQANYLGVPDQALLLEDMSESTWENAKLSLPLLKARKLKSVIIVTSPYHTRRALKTFRKTLGGGYTILVYPVQRSIFNPHDWWRRHEDTQPVINEYLSLIMYFFKGYL